MWKKDKDSYLRQAFESYFYADAPRNPDIFHELSGTYEDFYTQCCWQAYSNGYKQGLSEQTGDKRKRGPRFIDRMDHMLGYLYTVFLFTAGITGIVWSVKVFLSIV